MLLILHGKKESWTKFIIVNVKHKCRTNRNLSIFYWDTRPLWNPSWQLKKGHKLPVLLQKRNWERAWQTNGCDISLGLMQQHSCINIFLETLQLNSELIPYTSNIHKTLHITTRYLTTRPLWDCKVKISIIFLIFF